MTFGLVETLGRSIVAGRYSVDNPISTEAELANRFGVSRSVVREAVKMLTAKGLLSTRPRLGMYVRPETAWPLFDPDVLRWLLERKFSLKLLRDITEIRLAMEPAAAALAARHATAEGLASIWRAIERMRAAEAGEGDPLAAEIAFHVAILRATGNPFYAQLDELVRTALRITIPFTNSQKGVRQTSVPAHVSVLGAIAARDAPAAGAAMTSILTEAMDLIEMAGCE